MKQYLISLFEQNETYHTVKEKVAWEALSIYLAFSVLFMSWLHANINSWRQYPHCYVYSVIFAAFVPAFFFVIAQVYLKAMSARKSEMYMKFMCKDSAPTMEQFSFFMQEIQDVGKCCKQKWCLFWTLGWPGVWAPLSMAAFVAIQLKFVCMLLDL